MVSNTNQTTGDTERGVLVVTGILTQRSAFSTGGSDNRYLLDDALFRDGLDRPTMRGTSLAGALLASFRKCGFVDLPATITGDRPSAKGQRFVGESVLRVWNSHPMDVWHLDGSVNVACEPRQGVGIRQDTDAAANRALNDLEALPIGTRWPLVLEFDLWKYDSLLKQRLGKAAPTPWSVQQIDEALRVVLNEWAQGRCWLGRDVARGMGWMQLDELQIDEKMGETALTWTTESLFHEKGRRDFTEFRENVHKSTGKSEVSANASSTRNPSALQTVRSKAATWHYVRVTGTANCGARENGYGLDSLSLGGHQASIGRDKLLGSSHLVKPPGVDVYQPNLDMSIALTTVRRRANGNLITEPFVPGSSIRGALRHAMSRKRRSRGERVRDPVANSTYVDESPDQAVSNSSYPISTLFGEMPQQQGQPLTVSSRLLVRDAFLATSSSSVWKYAVMQMHAEDEFSAGSFSSAKFDRLAVVSASFAWEMMIECPHAEEKQAKQAAAEIFETLKNHDGHGLAIGGAHWRGHGWLQWSDIVVHCADAGDEKWTPVPESTDQPAEESSCA